jgi:hypothetical protein
LNTFKGWSRGEAIASYPSLGSFSARGRERVLRLTDAGSSLERATKITLRQGEKSDRTWLLPSWR